MIVHIAIGNSDDKLTQREWSRFVREVSRAIDGYAQRRHGDWRSPSDSEWQNACWCVEFTDPDGSCRIDALKEHLLAIAQDYRQDSIAWTESPATEFLGAGDDAA